MRLFVSMSAAGLFAVIVLAACNANDGSGSRAGVAGKENSSNANKPISADAPAAQPTAPSQNIPGDGVRRVTTAELRAALEKSAAVVIDVRSSESYKQGHIKGSKNIAEAEVAARISELPRDKMIVTYCS